MEKNLSRLERWFPPRQIYFKSHGEVHYWTLSPLLQKVFASGLIAALGWVGYASYNTVFRDQIIAAKDNEIAALEAESAEKSENLAVIEHQILEKTEELEARQGYLNSLIETDPTGEFPAAEESQDDREDADPVKESRAVFPGAFLFKGANAATDPKVSGQAFLDYITARLDLIEADQDRIARNLDAFATVKLSEIDDMLAPFKLTARDLADATRLDLAGLGQGGPFLPEGQHDPDLAAGDTYLDLQAKWTELLKAYTGFQNIPLSEPVEDFYLSSKFGRRTDPITKKAGWHPGIDLAGWPGTKIFATTAGVVTKAGPWGGYGNMVEIDHGNGFKTRYAHLRKVIAKRGQTVKPGDVLGEMGCTGRCVSTHLHYEVYFNGILRNPQPFMEAPEDVQQTKVQANGTPNP